MGLVDLAEGVVRVGCCRGVEGDVLGEVVLGPGGAPFLRDEAEG